MSEQQIDFSSAVKQLLKAMGLDPQNTDLIQTPQNVSELWNKEFLAGYQMDPKQILASAIEGETSPDAVFVTNLTFHSMCPHHLMPVRGKAHVAYIPDDKLLGFGKIAELVDCFTKRFTLQERATHQIAQALMEHLPARGAGCVMEAEHLCLVIPNEGHQASRVVTSAFLGEFKGREDLRSRLLMGGESKE